MKRLCAPIRYYGGKGRMVVKLLPLLPAGEVYVEPYCGAASLFFAKEPHPVEVLNDINHDVFNLFAVFRDKSAFAEFRRLVNLTPYSFECFKHAREIMRNDAPSSPNAERAWAFFVVQNQGFAGDIRWPGWGKVFCASGGIAQTVGSWLKKQALLDAFRRRLMMAQIDCRDALEVIRYWDSPKTVFYVDPPYVHTTRRDQNVYPYECDGSHHRALIDILLHIKGRAMVSGYECDIYRPLTRRWRVVRFRTTCSVAPRTRSTGLQGAGIVLAKQPRTEVVWIKD